MGGGAAGDYTVDVGGTLQTRSQFRLEVFVAGDVDGDHVVDRSDVDQVRRAYGAREGSSRYLASADANLDGRITAFDLSMARRNEWLFGSPPRGGVGGQQFSGAGSGGVADAVVVQFTITREKKKGTGAYIGMAR